MAIAALTLLGGHPALDLANAVERVPAPGAEPRDLGSAADVAVRAGRR